MKKLLLISAIAASMLSPVMASAAPTLSGNFWLGSTLPRDKAAYMPICIEREKKTPRVVPNAIHNGAVVSARYNRTDRENCECSYEVALAADQKLRSMGISSFDKLMDVTRNNPEQNKIIENYMNNLDKSCGWKE